MFLYKRFVDFFWLVKSVIWKVRRPRLKIGANPKIGPRTFFGKERDISIGNNFFSGINCHISCCAQIGNDVLLASYVSFVGGDHKIDHIDTTINKSGRDTSKQIIIEHNVWIGHGSIIMHGVTIGEGAVVAAGSVVTKNVVSKTIVGGVPAIYIRHRR
jgi:acetyltransferase-like isoleucine patch superfamily enzyme